MPRNLKSTIVKPVTVYLLHPVRKDAIRRDECKSNFSDNVRVTCLLTSCPICWLVDSVITPYPGQRGREVVKVNFLQTANFLKGLCINVLRYKANK